MNCTQRVTLLSALLLQGTDSAQTVLTAEMRCQHSVATWPTVIVNLISLLNSQGKIQLGRPRLRWNIETKIHLKEILRMQIGFIWLRIVTGSTLL